MEGASAERMEIEDVVVANLGDRNRILGADMESKEKSQGVLVGMLQMPSEETSTLVQDSTVVPDTKAQGGVMAGEEMTDSVMKSPVAEGAIVAGETQRWDGKVNGSGSDIANGKEAEKEGWKEGLKTMKALDADRFRITSSIAAGVAAGVAEGIAESIAETIAKETAGASGHASMEGREGRFERMAIAKAVAEVIAESVAQEVALGMADGLAEAAAAATMGVEPKKLEDAPQGFTEGNKDGVLCDCALVAVVRVVGEKSPNRGLRYLMCSRQDPSFFKRKGKRKESDTIGKCKFFRWLDTPRHTSKEDKKSQKTQQPEEVTTPLPTRSAVKESQKTQQPEEVTTPLPTRSAVKESNSGEAVPSEDAESSPDLQGKPSRKPQRKKSVGEELDAMLPASAGGTLTRSALRRGAPEPAQEPSLETSPVSALGKRTSDWTDSYTGPESQKLQASFRKRRSVRGESGPSNRRSTGFGSAEKKPLHYFRRSTGQVSDPVNLDSPQPVESPDEPDNRFKSYYKKGRSLEPKSMSAARAVEEVETEKKTKPQTRRQQRKLPLSEVYGAMEKQPTSKEIAGTDASLSPSLVVSEPKEVGLCSSPPKKRKLSWVLSEDSVVQESDTSKRALARKGNSLSAEKHTSLFETPLLASAFPTVRYEAKLPAEDYHDPDDPWSLEIPWAKQVHEEKVEKEEEETCEDEAMEGEDNEPKMHEEERIEAEEDLNPGGISELDSAAGGKESDIQRTPVTVVDASTSLVDGPEAGEDLKQSHVDTDTMPDEITASEDELLPNPDSSVHSRSFEIKDPQPTHLEGVQRSEDFAELPAPDKGLTPDVVVPEDHVVENAQELVLGGMNKFEAPEEMSDEQPTGDKTQMLAAAQTGADEHATTETDHERFYEQPETADEPGEPVHDLQGTDDPAISGSNLMADGRTVDELNELHEAERDDASPHALKSPGAAAASENAGNSVWRSASGKKTRSIGSIGAPAVTSKRSRSVGGGPKGGGGGGPKRQQAEVLQWVDVPLDWRNEKSTGRAPLLLPHFSQGKASDTTQSEMRLLQSMHPRVRRGEVDDSSIITEEKEKAHLNDHASFNEDSTDYDHAQINNVARQAALQGSEARDGDYEGSVPAPASGELLVGAGQQQALAPPELGDNVAQRRKRGRPRKDSKKPGEFQYFVADGHKNLEAAAAADANQSTPEPELLPAGVLRKADGEPSSTLILCSPTIEEGNTTVTELHGEHRVSQLERSASNTERENGFKPESLVSSEPEECGISLDGSDVPSNSTLEGLQSEVDAPHCLCKVIPRQAVLKTVDRSGDPNQGLRYWSCSNYRKLFTKKKKPQASDVTEESCNFFRWLDTPRVTAKDKREARKERYRQVELQRLL